MALAAVALLVAGCHALDAPTRRTATRALFLEPGGVIAVVDPRTPLAQPTPGGALRLDPGFRAGESLQERLALPAPARGFAEALVGTLATVPGLADSTIAMHELPAARPLLEARGTAPVLFLHATDWRLFYGLSLADYRMKVMFSAQVEPAAQVLAGEGPMALPGVLWSGRCTWISPGPGRPVEAWAGEDGALLRTALGTAQRRCADRIAGLLEGFLAGAAEQSAFDVGELPPDE